MNIRWLARAAFLAAGLASTRLPAADVTHTATQLVRASGVSGGMCAVLGAGDVELPAAIAKQGAFVVHCLYTQPAPCETARKALRARGLYGDVSADTFAGSRLPYVDNLLNIVVLDGYPGPGKCDVPLTEVLRVLAPLGTAYFRGSPPTSEETTGALRGLGIANTETLSAEGTWLVAHKPWPAAMDQWTHYLHGADGNPVARDRLVGPPRHYQWIAGPEFLRCHETDSSVSTLVTAQGRLFAIVDEAPISLAGDHSLPDKWSLVARDAFNGVLLWKVPIRRWGWREWKASWFNTRPGDIPLNIQKRLVADGDRVYVTLGYRAPVSQLDARSGEILQTYAGTEQTGEILFHNGTLVLSALEGRQFKVMAVDAASGKVLWKSAAAYRGSTTDYIKWKEMNGGSEPVELDPALNMACDGMVVALLDRTQLLALDFRTGAERWRADFPLADADRNAGGIQAQDNLWVGTMIVRNGVVVHASPHCLAAFDAASGKRLWSQPKKFLQHLWYEWKDVFVIGDLVWTWSAEVETGLIEAGRTGKQRTTWPKAANGYDLHTGELKKSVPTGSVFKANHHHRCYRNKATERYILASRRGSEFIDLEGGPHTIDNWVRGTCHVGMMPANGLHYAPPHPCQCYIEEKLNGMNALAAATASRAVVAVDDKDRLVRGPAFASAGVPVGSAAGAEDWPTFRHDTARTGSASTRLADEAGVLWRVRPGRHVSPPIVADGRVFLALVDEHHVACLDAHDGALCWEFAAGARVDSPPTYHNGTVLFGSNDGWVYCLRAREGQLMWRFQAASDGRRMAAFGQLESAWPVHGSVLVQGGTAYFVAGRSSHLDGGLRLYGLDAATGQIRHQAMLTGPHYASDNIEANFQLPTGSLPDILAGDGTNVHLRGTTFDAGLKPQPGKAALQATAGYLDDNYFKRMPWTLANEYARLIVHDRQNACYVRMFDSLRGLDPTVFFTPGAKGYLLFAKDLSGRRTTWSQRVPMRIRAMVLAGNQLVVAGPPDTVDRQDPLGAFEGRKGAVLWIIDSASGARVAQHALPSPPVFNGAAAAAGRLVVAEEDGTVTCFGPR